MTVSGDALTEQAADRRQYPSHWSSVHTGGGLRVDQRKFITENNVAVTILTLTNTGSESTTRTITAGQPGHPVVRRRRAGRQLQHPLQPDDGEHAPQW